MITKSEDLYLNTFREAFEFLDNAQYLTEQESIYYPEMVVIRENTSVGKYIIRLEEFIDFSLSNGINDGSYALQEICRASQIDPNTVAFSVDEVNILEDADLEDTVRQLLETNIPIYSSPISENNMVYIITESLVQLMLETDGTTEEDYIDQLYESFISGDSSYLTEEVVDLVKNKAESAYQGAKDSAGNVVEKIQTVVKKGKNNSRKLAAETVSSLRKVKGKLAEAPKNVINKVDQGIDHLQSKLKGDN